MDIRRLFPLAGLLLAACGSSGDSLDVPSLFGPIEPNPTGSAPLTARIAVTAPADLAVKLTVAARTAADDDYVRTFPVSRSATPFQLPILGLYAGFDNVITFEVAGADGQVLGTHAVHVTTDPLPADFPGLEASGTYAGDDFTFLTYIRAPVARQEVVGLMVDKRGNVRWYSDFPIASLFPMQVFDGTIYCGDGGNRLKRYDFLGKELLDLDLSVHGYTGIHHDILLRPNGDLVLTVDRVGGDQIHDTVIEIDPSKNVLRRVWDLRKTFPDVTDLFTDIPKTGPEQPGVTNDPIHNNSVWYDETGNALVVCSERSGVQKLYAGGQLKWMLAPHLVQYIDDADGDGVSDSFAAGYDPDNRLTWTGAFDTAAYKDQRYPIAGKPTADYSGFDFRYSAFLLTPLDPSGAPIPDDAVRKGFQDGAGFAWPFRPHAAKITRDGHYLLFDNGLARNFNRVPLSPASFSRAVEYEVVEDTADGMGGTVRQVWEHRLVSDPSWYSMSAVVGDVEELADGHRLIVAGAIGTTMMPDAMQAAYGDGPRGALVVEVDPATDQEVHRLFVRRNVMPDYPLTELTAYRAVRVDAYAGFLPAGSGTP